MNPKPPDENDRHRAGALPDDPFAYAEDVRAPHEEPPPYDGPPFAPHEEAEPEKEEAVDPWGTWGAVPMDWLEEEPPARSFLLWADDTRGLLPRGKVGFLAAEGGFGKTMALIDLAVSVATRGSWFGAYPAEQGRVLLLLGEEDEGEIRRRIWTIAAAKGLDEAGRRAVSENIVAVALAGHSDLALTAEPERGSTTVDTDAARTLVDRVKAEAAAGCPFALVALDPFARFAGSDAEKDNAAATRVIQVVEKLAGEACGSPTVMVLHHTSQAARTGETSGSAGIRGVTGITDGARWAAMLAPDPIPDTGGRLIKADRALFSVVKTNYTAKPEPLHLVRGSHGALRCEQPDEKANREEVQQSAEEARERKAAEKRAEKEAEAEARGTVAFNKTKKPSV